MVLKCPTGYLFRWIGVEGGEAVEKVRGEDPWDRRRGKGLGRSDPGRQIYPNSHSLDWGCLISPEKISGVRIYSKYCVYSRRGAHPAP
jgi:hypothetical protein